MGGALAESAARLAAGAAIVACAAIGVFAIGGDGLFAGLGSLFGREGESLQIAEHRAPAADVVAAPTAAERRAAPFAPAGSHEPVARPRDRSRRAPAPRNPAPRGDNPQPAPTTPQPAPQIPPPPPPAPPAPAPGGGTVGGAGDAVKQLVEQVPPQLEPLKQPVADAVDLLVDTCAGLPVCP